MMLLKNNPEGVAAQSPRLLYSATLGRRIALLPNPNGVVALVLQGRSTTNVAPLCKSIRQDATPSGLGPMTKEVLGSTPSPRVAEYSNPGLKDETPSGLSVGKPSGWETNMSNLQRTRTTHM